MKALTAGQQEVFDLIRDHISQTGMPPTRAEIAQRLGFRSPNAAEEHLKALARKGCLKSFPAHREVSVCYRKKRTDYHLSGVSRRVNRFWRSSILKAITVDPSLFKPSADFLLRVSGMSMKDIGIMDGDLLAVHKTQDVRNGGGCRSH